MLQSPKVVATQICFLRIHSYLANMKTHFDEHIFQMGWFNHQPGLFEGRDSEDLNQLWSPIGPAIAPTIVTNGVTGRLLNGLIHGVTGGITPVKWSYNYPTYNW